MTRFNLLASSLLFGSLFTAGKSEAQQVSADIRIHSGPVAGRVIVVPERRVYVERIRFDRRFDRRWAYDKHQRKEWERWRRDYDHWRNDWHRRLGRNYRVIVVYYDRRDDCFYDRFRPGLEEISVYEQDGRLYRLDDDESYYDQDRWDRGDRYDRDDRYDRYDRDRDDRDRNR